MVICHLPAITHHLIDNTSDAIGVPNPSFVEDLSAVALGSDVIMQPNPSYSGVSGVHDNDQHEYDYVQANPYEYDYIHTDCIKSVVNKALS